NDKLGRVPAIYDVEGRTMLDTQHARYKDGSYMAVTSKQFVGALINCTTRSRPRSDTRGLL
ncbi:MAG: hypothetical protein ABI612_21900, partial [Betaproteobacteria bacterium]